MNNTILFNIKRINSQLKKRLIFHTPLFFYKPYGKAIFLIFLFSQNILGHAQSCQLADTSSITLTTFPNTTVCPNTNVQIGLNTNKPPLNIQWSNGETLPNTSFQINEPQTISVEFEITGENLIRNSDFENGNQDFRSDYTFRPSDLEPEFTYLIGKTGRAAQDRWSPCGDHTTGESNKLLVNGSTIPNAIVWEQTIQIEVGVTYAFSTWVATEVAISPAQLQFSINGNTIGEIFSAPDNTCIWNQFYVTWKPNTNDSIATIRILNQNTIDSGNDFALDDIEFAPICTLERSVTLNVLPTNPINNIITSTCNVAEVGIRRDTLNAILTGCDSIVETTTILSPPFFEEITLFTCEEAEVGVDFDTIRSLDGCLTITETTRIYNEPDTIIQNQIICQTDSLLFFGQWLNATGNYSQSFNNIAGCDSLFVILTLEVVVPFVEITEQFICPNGQVNWRGNIYREAGIYQETVSSIIACDSTFELILEEQAPLELTSAINDTVISYGQSINITANLNFFPNTVRFLWFPSTGVECDTCLSTTILPERNIELERRIYIPTAFSPNRDGRNDYFTLYGIPSSGEIIELNIFDRWGELVFFGKNLQFNDLESGWDGRFNNQDLQPGVYVYTAQILAI